MLLPNPPAGGSARHLVITHAASILNGDKLPDLKPGEQQLFSFFKPGLEAGIHTVNVKQDINVDGEKKSLPDSENLQIPQQFNVIAPRFTLPAGSVHSTYPPSGHADHVETLPHIVLMDQHLPWERVASKVIPVPNDTPRNKVPWLAVLVFTQEELRLEEPMLNQTGIFSGTEILKFPVTQATTLGINMKISDILKTKDTTSPITKLGDLDLTAQTDVIFLKKELFTSLVTTYDDDGNPKTPQTAPDVSRYKFLAHVRNTNTQGMAEACLTDGHFSIVVSHRVGPINITQPTPVVVHLISIEGVENMTLPIPTQFVALSSLQSWTYTCLPPSSLNVLEMFRDLGNTLDVLRAPMSIIEAVLKAPERAVGAPKETIKELRSRERGAARVAARLMDGYSLVRYYTQSGEETVALTRSPFTPTTIPHPLTDWKLLSTFGTDLQIFDQEAGVMDITYSSAWQLGKTLGLADQIFGAALGRVRTLVYDKGMNNAKAEALTKVGGYQTQAQTLESIPKSVQTLIALPEGDLLMGEGKMLDRWQRPAVETLNLSFGSPAVNFVKHAGGVMQTLARTTDGEGHEFYNEVNSPYSTDWMIVFKWVQDKMSLIGVPAHYLITDPSHLPRESLRFFHIDPNWVDALVDGALSVANHFDKQEDFIRDSIKVTINKYLATVNPKLGYAPQIPTYGFLLRSDLCSQFPDLAVSTTHTNRAPLLRHENIDDGVMLCLFDRVPSGPEFESLKFTQPPHQQCFSVGGYLHADELMTQYKTVYTNRKQGDPDHVPITQKVWKKGDKKPVFLWGKDAEIRTLRFPAWADDVYESIKAGMNAVVPESFDDPHPDDKTLPYPGSALAGIQLGTPVYWMQIELKDQAALKSLVPTDPLQPGPRSLKMMQARVPNPTDTVPASAGPPIPKAAPLPMASLPPFGKRIRPAPLSATAPPPHFRFLRTSAASHPSTPQPSRDPTTTVPKPPSQSQVYQLNPSPTPISDHDPAGPVNFVCGIYPIDGFTANEIPTGGDTTWGQDLVFSVVLASGGNNDLSLTELELAVPRGDVAHGGLLLEYNGPGATMLSNMRFNILLQPDKNKLLLRLMPRSAGRMVHLSTIKEMSFLLSMVKVNQPKKTKILTIGMKMSYSTGAPRTDDFDIALLGTED